MRLLAILPAGLLAAGCASVSASDGAGRPSGSRVEVVMLAPGPSYDRVSHAQPQRGPAPLPASAASVSAVAQPVESKSERIIVEPTRPRPAIEQDTPPGIVRPYSTRRFFRGFGRCVGNHHYHPAIDLGGVGKDWGLGTPIKAMVRSRVVFIGRPQDQPGEFGTLDTRSGKVVRGGTKLPRSKVIKGYGRVYFFTRTKGRWRSGTILVTKGMDGTPLADHKIRYMHLGAVHPGLKPGDVIEAGQEIGLMGGTGVQQSAPHVHIDIEDPDGRRIDVAPLIGLSPTAEPCPKPTAVRGDGAGGRVWSKTVSVRPCGTWRRDEDFSSGEFYAHDVVVQLRAGDRLTAELQRTSGRWRPRMEIRDQDGNVIDNGSAVSGRRGAVMARRTKSGRSGSLASVELEASGPVTLTVRSTAWPRPKPGHLLPKDGAYTLTLRRDCPR